MKTAQLLMMAFIACTLLACTSKTESITEDDSYQETREIEGVSRILVSGVFNLFISQGDMESLRIEGDEELAKKLVVRQRGDLLELSLKEEKVNIFKKTGLQVHLTIADLSELEFEGAGNIQSRGQLELGDFRVIGKGVGNIELDLEADEVEADLNFVGNMTLKGAADYFKLFNEGVGNIDASQFWVQQADVNSSGIGMVSVHCEGELSLLVSGIGTVSYTGNPTVVSEKVSGIGKVNRN
jgi:hypothetical protein